MLVRSRRMLSIQAALRAKVEPDEFRLRLTSEPFPVRDLERVAVKVVDADGNEPAVVQDLPT